MDMLGQTIGQYQLIELIHQGDNAVYKGFQPALNRYVAVKILASAQNNPAFTQQFQRDMQGQAGLEHPNILSLLDYGDHNGLLYLVTPFIEGGTLQDRLTQFRPLPQAQQIINGLAGALDYLHSRGIVSGNLKPSNILIDPQGQPLLTDFGYTQGIDTGLRENAYLSPELAQSGQLDPRADVYALGVLLYELLIGQPPPAGAAPSPRHNRPDLPVEVEQVILKAMAPYPEQRFQSAGELSQALNRALPAPAAPQQLQAAPPPPPPAPAAEPQPSSSRTGLIVGGLVVLLIAIIACGVLLFSFRGGSSTPEPAPSPTAGDTTTPTAPAPSTDPVAIISAPTNGLVGEPVTFDAGNSMPGDSPIDRYEWEFGDGDTANAVRVDHAYNSAGNFRVTLRVIDGNGLESTARSDIQIEPAEPEAPAPTEEPPPTEAPPPTEEPAPTESPPEENLPEAEPLPDEGEG